MLNLSNKVMEKCLNTEKHKDELIMLALSDKASFNTIRQRFDLSEADLKLHMKRWLKPGSYKAWRVRVSRFRKRRSTYKRD